MLFWFLASFLFMEAAMGLVIMLGGSLLDILVVLNIPVFLFVYYIHRQKVQYKEANKRRVQEPDLHPYRASLDILATTTTVNSSPAFGEALQKLPDLMEESGVRLNCSMQGYMQYTKAGSH